MQRSWGYKMRSEELPGVVGKVHPVKPRARFLICKWGKWTVMWSQCSTIFVDFISFVRAPHCHKLYLLLGTVILKMVGCMWLSPTSSCPPSHPNLGPYLRINDLGMLWKALWSLEYLNPSHLSIICRYIICTTENCKGWLCRKTS